MICTMCYLQSIIIIILIIITHHFNVTMFSNDAALAEDRHTSKCARKKVACIQSIELTIIIIIIQRFVRCHNI